MRESYSEDLASHAGLESYADGGNVMGVATAEVYAGELTQRVPGSEITIFVCRPSLCCGKTIRVVTPWQETARHGGVEDPQHA